MSHKKLENYILLKNHNIKSTTIGKYIYKINGPNFHFANYTPSNNSFCQERSHIIKLA